MSEYFRRKGSVRRISSKDLFLVHENGKFRVQLVNSKETVLVIIGFPSRRAVIETIRSE